MRPSLPSETLMPARTAYRQLQAIRDRLPQYRPHARPPQLAENILALANVYDFYWFDAFGVLNVGPQPIPDSTSARKKSSPAATRCWMRSPPTRATPSGD